VDQADGHRVEEVQLLPTRATGDDELGVLEHLQVLHDPEPRHLEGRLQLGQRLAVTDQEPIEKPSARAVRQRLENRVVVLSHSGEHR
jgi:hypothetical protein